MILMYDTTNIDVSAKGTENQRAANKVETPTQAETEAAPNADLNQLGLPLPLQKGHAIDL